jgi:8-oxo-dGTP pyrophosphatase MutT (NUDIX family)
MIFYDTKNQQRELPAGRQIEWRISAYAAIKNENGELLTVVPTWRDTYDLPGGGVEMHETIAQGIERECYEETGYKVKVTADLPLYVSETNFYWIDRDAYCHSVNFIYPAELASPEPDPTAVDPKETAQVKWVDPNSLTKENCHSLYYPAVELLRKS